MPCIFSEHCPSSQVVMRRLSTLPAKHIEGVAGCHVEALVCPAECCDSLNTVSNWACLLNCLNRLCTVVSDVLCSEYPSYCIVGDVAEQSDVCSVNCRSTLLCTLLIRSLYNVTASNSDGTVRIILR
jgi:hypothetical protein